MPYVRWLNDLRIADHAWAGDKAARLGELIGAGFQVPRGFCVGMEAYRDVVANPLNARIAARLAATEIDDPVDLESAAEEIRAWIENAAMPDALIADIQPALGELGQKSFAVRASRVVEDVPNPTASGLQQAFLGVVGVDAILAQIRACWATPWNSRAIYFRHRKKIGHAQVTMAVVVQPMIQADAAGVLFTANPLTGTADEIHIDATFGLGEAVIAARWKPDHFVVTKNALVIHERVIPSKAVMDMVSPEGGLQTVSVPANQQDAPALSDAQTRALAEIGKGVEAHFKQTQDIEWCRVGENFLLLQTRPLTK